MNHHFLAFFYPRLGSLPSLESRPARAHPARARPAPSRRRSPPRRQRLLRRTLPIGAVALAAFVGGAIAGADRTGPEHDIADRYARAWAAGDYAGLHSLLAPEAQERYSARRVGREYTRAADTLTLESVRTGRPVELQDGSFAIPVRMRTRVFGDLRGTLRLPFTGDDDDAAVDWTPELVFPGLRRGERLRRTTDMPPRADILTRDGEALAAGEVRTSELGALVADIAGRLGPIPPERAEEYKRRGVPKDALVGLTGLEREFDQRLAGIPGGGLFAGKRRLARAEPRKGAPVRASIDADVQRATVAALAGRYGGAAVLEPSTGEVLALAGIASSAPQPPGSTFKIITASAVLEAGLAKPDTTFPVQTETQLEGVTLENANQEACGGTLKNSFAHSCNTVFAPLGARLGAKRLVAMAEKFGFNEEPTVAGAARSTLPKAEEVGDDLAVGSTAIGQGRTLTTPLQMASIAATIANHGKRAKPTLLRNDPERDVVDVVSARTARRIRSFMLAVVQGGTGAAAAIGGVSVAGKTGTAELRTTQGDEVEQQAGEEELAPEDDEADTDAWFTAFAPAGKPRAAVAVMFVGAGAGGETAAPVARQILVAALKRNE